MKSDLSVLSLPQLLIQYARDLSEFFHPGRVEGLQAIEVIYGRRY